MPLIMSLIIHANSFQHEIELIQASFEKASIEKTEIIEKIFAQIGDLGTPIVGENKIDLSLEISQHQPYLTVPQSLLKYANQFLICPETHNVEGA